MTTIKISVSLRKDSGGKQALFINIPEVGCKILQCSKTTYTKVIKLDDRIKLVMFPHHQAGLRKFLKKATGGNVRIDPKYFIKGDVEDIKAVDIDAELFTYKTGQVGIDFEFNEEQFLLGDVSVVEHHISAIYESYNDRQVVSQFDLSAHQSKVLANELIFEKYEETHDENLWKLVWVVKADGTYEQIGPKYKMGKYRELMCAHAVRAIACLEMHGDDAIDFKGRGIELKSAGMKSALYGKTPQGKVRHHTRHGYARGDAFARFREYETTDKDKFNKPTYFIVFDEDTIEPIECWYLDGNDVVKLVHKEDKQAKKDSIRVISLAQFEENGKKVAIPKAMGWDAWTANLTEWKETAQNRDPKKKTTP